MDEIDLDGEFDFGFETLGQDDLVDNIYRENLQKMYDMIVPLLDNLSKDADKNPIIKWPDRAKTIRAFKKKLDALLIQ